MEVNGGIDQGARLQDWIQMQSEWQSLAAVLRILQTRHQLKK